jgi:hypothetical protein
MNDCDFLLFIGSHTHQMLEMSSIWSMHARTCLIIECRILSEWTGKDVEGNSLALFRIPLRHLHDGIWKGGTWMLIKMATAPAGIPSQLPHLHLKVSPLQKTFGFSCVANIALAQSSKYGGSGPYGTCGRLSRTWTLFCLTTSVFSVSYYSRNAVHSSDITGLYSRLVSHSHLLLYYGIGSNKQLLL